MTRSIIVAIFLIAIAGSFVNLIIASKVFNVAYHMFVIGLSSAILLGNYFSQREIDRRDIAREKKRIKRSKYVRR